MPSIAKGGAYILVVLLCTGQTRAADDEPGRRISAGSSDVITVIAAGQAFGEESGKTEPEERGGQKDPGYRSYQEGYRLILAERWAEARKKLAEVLQKSPRSGYADDASFWIAYSWKYSDRAKAIAAYKKFIRDYPESNYFDDVVAELGRLGDPSALISVREPVVSTGALEEIAKLQKEIAAEQARMSHFEMPPAVVMAPKPPRQPEKSIQVKIETLRALGRSPDDEKTFRTLEEVALDPAQAPEVRQAGLEGLIMTRRPERSDALARVLQSKSDVRLRLTALYGLRTAAAKGDSVSYALARAITLDKSEPVELRDATLQYLAQEKRRDFQEIASSLARTEQQLKLQQRAIYCIARAERMDQKKMAAETLRQLVHDRMQAAEVRRSALYGLQQLKLADNTRLLLEIAQNDPDEDLRRTAILSLGEGPGESPSAVSRTLEEFARNPSQPVSVRQSALARLLALRPDNAQEFFAQIATSDPNEEVQYLAIMMLSQGKNASLETLTQLYRQVPPERVRSLDVILYSIASIGSDPAVNFLVNVANESPSDELKMRAVYYLGSIGGEKARAGLTTILKRE